MQYMYYIRTINKETISDTGAINVTTPGLRRYFTEINKIPIADPITMCSDMIRLAKIWKNVSGYSQMKILQKFNENTKLFLASYFYRFSEENITEDIVCPILECMQGTWAVCDPTFAEQGHGLQGIHRSQTRYELEAKAQADHRPACHHSQGLR